MEEQGDVLEEINSTLKLSSSQVNFDNITLPLLAGHLYCEDCYGKYLAPNCEKCRKKILGVSEEMFQKINRTK